MARDHIVEEVRRFREDQASKYEFDIKEILAAERKEKHRLQVYATFSH